MGVIFDLDQTLIDSSSAEIARRAKQWSKVYSLIPGFPVYEGVNKLIEELVGANVPVCIVTNSPQSYCLKVINHHALTIPSMVCYHDVNQRKPHPEPMIAALAKLGLTADKVISVGDDAKDIIASHAAGITRSIGAFWGCVDPKSLTNARPAFSCYTVAELRQVLFEQLQIG